MTIEVDATSYGGTITAIDYLKRRVTIDGHVPKRLTGHFFEAGGDYHKTSFEVDGIEPVDGGTVLHLRKGLEIMRTRLRSVDAKAGTVVGAIAMIRVRGRDKGLVASTDDMKKWWRVEYTGGSRHDGHVFKLSHLAPNATGPVFSEADSPSGAGLSVWEFGAGDSIRIKTGVSLRRRGDGAFEVYATAPFKLTMPIMTIGARHQTFLDRMVRR